MILVGNPMMGIRKVVDIMDSRGIGRIMEVATIDVIGVIKRVFIAAEMINYMAEMRISVETEMLPMINTNLFKNYLYLHPYRLWRLVSRKQQW